MRAVILAGGKGRRLLPFTINFPKPLVPLGDVPILELLLTRLVKAGLTDITLSLGHLAELIKAYLSNRPDLLKGMKLDYVCESQPAGTAGSLAFVPGLTETFIVMNGDLLTNLNFKALLSYHRQQGALLTIATHLRTVKIDFGVLELDGQKQVTEYIEKPEKTYHVSMGIYVYEPEVLRYIKRGCYLDFPNLVLRLIEKGEKVCAFPTDCLWLDIGRHDDYAQAQEMFDENRVAFDYV